MLCFVNPAFSLFYFPTLLQLVWNVSFSFKHFSVEPSCVKVERSVCLRIFTSQAHCQFYGCLANITLDPVGLNMRRPRSGRSLVWMPSGCVIYCWATLKHWDKSSTADTPSTHILNHWCLTHSWSRTCLVCTPSLELLRSEQLHEGLKILPNISYLPHTLSCGVCLVSLTWLEPHSSGFVWLDFDLSGEWRAFDVLSLGMATL